MVLQAMPRRDMDSGRGMSVMDKRDIALIWLSLQLTIMSYQLYK